MTSNIAHHLQLPNDANLPTTNPTTVFNDPSFDTLARAIPQSDNPGPIAHHATGFRLPRQRRRLEYVKCDFCRRSKKKCQPSERQWPGEKCQRCNAKGLTCSAPAKKNRDVSDALIVDNISSLARAAEDLPHEERAYCSLAETSIRQMCSVLRRNICKLPSQNTGVGTIHRGHVDKVLSEDLQYACRFWVLHLERGKVKFLVDADLQNQVYNFLTGYFLCWLEALSLLQLVHDGINSLESLERLVNDTQSTSTGKLRGFVHDAKRFVLDYRTDIERFPLNIYTCALLPLRRGLMKEINIPRLQAWSESHCGEIWGTLTSILEGHYAMILDIAFSPGGKLLAIASSDKTIKLWDLATRRTLRVLAFGNLIEIIAFSPDGSLLACTFDSGQGSTLKLLDPTTGKGLQTPNFIKSITRFRSIAFSQDGKLLASTSDEMVRLWDSATGCQLRTLSYNYEAVSVAFSPDGKLLASAWEDGALKLWDPHTGSEIITFAMHNGFDFAIAFSPDSQLLALSSPDDSTVTIWDPALGIKLQALVGHTNNISSIAFSPDGKLLASASFDDTVRLWDLATGREQGTLVVHGKSAASIALSPNGSLLACVQNLSISRGAVNLWEPHGYRSG